MQPFEQIKEYSIKVCEQIRWKKAKPIIATEIENHLCDQRDAYILDGNDENIATQKAIAQMGDAVLVGKELDKTHKPKPQFLMITLTGILMLLGLSINYFINTSINSLATFNVLSYILAFGVFLSCYFLDFTILKKHSKMLYVFILVVSIISVILGTEVNGRHYWLSVSLSYLALIYPLVFALFAYNMRNKGMRGILLCGIAYLPFAVILLIIPSITGLILYTITALITLCYAIHRGWFGVKKLYGFLLVLVPTIVVLGILVLGCIAPYASNRLSIFLNPEQDARGAGYLYWIIRNILSGASFFGKGSTQFDIEVTSSILPEIHTDHTLIYLINQFGFIVLFGITALMMIFSAVGITKALKQKSVLGSVVALSIVVTFILQALLYIIDNLGYSFIPSLSLPFISFGYSALLIDSALIGFMLSIFRTGNVFRDSHSKNGNKDKRTDSIFSYDDGKLIINLRAKHF